MQSELIDYKYISESVGYTVEPIKMWDGSFVIKQGCYSAGFCHDCGVIIEDSTCYCLGGTCFRCGKFVPGDNFPAYMRGKFECYNRVTKKIVIREYNND